MKQPEWQRGGICGALSSTSQQLNIEPSEQRERERGYIANSVSYSNMTGMKLYTRLNRIVYLLCA